MYKHKLLTPDNSPYKSLVCIGFLVDCQGPHTQVTYGQINVYSLFSSRQLWTASPQTSTIAWKLASDEFAYKQETVKEKWKYTNEVRCAGGGMILYPWPSISNQSSSSANRPDLHKSDLCWTFDHTVTRWFQCNEIRTIQHFRVWPLEPHMPTCAWPTCTRHRDEHVCLKCVWVWMWVWVCHYLWITHFTQSEKSSHIVRFYGYTLRSKLTSTMTSFTFTLFLSFKGQF